MKRFIFMLLATLSLNVAYAIAKEATPILMPEPGTLTVMFCSDQLDFGIVPEYNFTAYTVDACASFEITQGCRYAVLECDWSLFNWRNTGTDLIPYSLYRAESMARYIISYQSRLFPKPAYAHQYIKFSHKAKC